MIDYIKMYDSNAFNILSMKINPNGNGLFVIHSRDLFSCSDKYNLS